LQLIEKTWRKRVRVERTDDRLTCRPPVLKTGLDTRPVTLPFLLRQQLPFVGVAFGILFAS